MKVALIKYLDGLIMIIISLLLLSFFGSNTISWSLIYLSIYFLISKLFFLRCFCTRVLSIIYLIAKNEKILVEYKFHKFEYLEVRLLFYTYFEFAKNKDKFISFLIKLSRFSFILMPLIVIVFIRLSSLKNELKNDKF